ncbi:hypothetical protein ADL26_11495, partial [Thermoactinomyces vulgaris]
GVGGTGGEEPVREPRGDREFPDRDALQAVPDGVGGQVLGVEDAGAGYAGDLGEVDVGGAGDEEDGAEVALGEHRHGGGPQLVEDEEDERGAERVGPPCGAVDRGLGALVGGDGPHEVEPGEYSFEFRAEVSAADAQGHVEHGLGPYLP